MRYLRAWRRYRHLTQEQLADRAGVDRGTIHHAEKGRSVHASTFQKLARALRISPERLDRPPPGHDTPS